MADSINSNNPAVDGMGRSYPGIDKSLLQSLMSGKVGDAKAFNSKGTDEVKEEIKKLAKLLSSKNTDFVKDLQKVVKYIDEMKKVVSSMNEKSSSKKETPDFGNMANALGKILAPLIKTGDGTSFVDAISKVMSGSKTEMKTGFKSMERGANHLASLFSELIKMWEPFVDEGLKKGSIFTRDERMRSQLSKGLKLEKGTMKKLAGSVFSGGTLSQEFKETLDSLGIKNSVQEKIAKAFQDAASLTSGGMSEKEAFTKAFKDASAGMSGNTKKEFMQARGQILELAKQHHEEVQKAEEAVNPLAHFKGFGKSVETTKKIIDKIGGYFTSFAKDIADVDMSFSGIAQKAKDQYKVQLDYQRSLYQTMGTAGNLAETQEALNQLAYTYKDTGVMTVEAYKVAAKYQKSGLKTTKDNAKVIKSQLAAEKQIGLEAGTLTDHFMDMRQGAEMSAIEVSQVAIDMGNVAKSSGLTGDAMKHVVDKAKDLNKHLQSMGTFTVEASKNSLSILAEAKKLGIADEAAEMMKGMSGMEAFMKSQQRGLIANAARASGTMNDVLAGTLMDDPKKLKEFATGLKQVNSQLLNKNIAKQYQVNSYEELRKLTYAARTDENAKSALIAINAAARAQGTTAEAMLKTPDAMLKGTRTLNEKLQDIEKDKTKSDLQRTKLEEQAKSDATSSLLGKLGEAAQFTDGKDLNTVLEAFKKDTAVSGDMAAMGMTGAGDVLKKSLEDVNKRLTAAGGKELGLDQKKLDEALASGNKEDLQNVIATLQEGQQQAATLEQQANNPADRAAASLKKLEDFFVTQGAGWFNKISGALTWIGGLVPVVGTILTTIIAIKTMAKAREALASIKSGSSVAPAPPPRLDPAPAPPPNLDEKGKKIKGTPAPAPPPNMGETKGADAAKPKKGKGTAAPSTKSKGFEFEEKLPTGRKSMWQKTKSFGSGVKGKIGGLFSGGAALAGGLAETAVNALGGGGDEGGGCACSIAESALSQVGSLAGVATDAASATAEAALDATKKTGKNVANVADDAAKGAAKGAAKSAAKATAGVADDAVKAAGQSAGLMSKATGFLGKTVGFLGKAAGPLAAVAGAGIEIAAGGDVTEAISGGAGGLVGGGLGAAVGSLLGPLGTVAGGVIGGYAGDWLGRIGSEYLPGIWEGAKNVSANIWEGAKNVGSNIASSIGAAGSWAGDKISGAASWAGDKISGAASAVGDAAGWAGDKISGAASAVANSTVGKAVGGAASWAGDKISGAASSVGSAASAGWSKFTGWLGFAEGAREIENSGLAMLHKGEVIFPMEIVKSLVAKGTSSFGSLGGFLENVGGGLTSAASKFTESGGVTGLLGSAATKLGSTIVDSVGGFFGSTSKMQGEMANAEMKSGSDKAATVSTSGSSMLSAIATASESQVTVSKEIRDILRDMLSNMINSNAGMGGEGENYVGISTNRDAFKSPIGNINDSSVKNVSQIAYG